MEWPEFHDKVRKALPPGAVLENPGGGTSTILSYALSGNRIKITFQRGGYTLHVTFEDLYGAYQYHRGRTVSSTELREYAPEVFDPAYGGHSDNCTLLFKILKAIAIVTSIQGSGRRGSPFFVTIPMNG